MRLQRVLYYMCDTPKCAVFYRHVIVFCEVNTRSRKLHALDYCRLSTLALLLVHKVDLLPDHIQNYCKSEKRKEYMCTFFQTLSVCIHVINNVNVMDSLWYRGGCDVRYKRQ